MDTFDRLERLNYQKAMTTLVDAVNPENWKHDMYQSNGCFLVEYDVDTEDVIHSDSCCLGARIAGVLWASELEDRLSDAREKIEEEWEDQESRWDDSCYEDIGVRAHDVMDYVVNDWAEPIPLACEITYHDGGVREVLEFSLDYQSGIDYICNQLDISENFLASFVHMCGGPENPFGTYNWEMDPLTVMQKMASYETLPVEEINEWIARYEEETLS